MRDGYVTNMFHFDDDRSRPDRSTIFPGDGDHGGPRRRAVLEVGPARRRRLEGRALALARMLDGKKQRAIVRREGWAADLRTPGCGEELPRQRPALARHVAGVEPVGDARDLA